MADDSSLYSGFIALAAGLSVGMGGLAAGYAIGIVGDYVSTRLYRHYNVLTFI
jgi:F0F1-type ATP synthase membrane subunit c/vacuolar-type H+-ATPase subunit K